MANNCCPLSQPIKGGKKEERNGKSTPVKNLMITINIVDSH